MKQQAATPSDRETDGYFLSGKEKLAIRRREYHYNAWSSTLLDPYLQPFWRWLVKQIPKWITPSTLSVCGLACNLVATIITAAHAPTLTERLPTWVSLLNALSIFLYQTFDGIDGKQCFRTQNSEVEEYMDHAVDSISVIWNAVLLAAALQLGDHSALLGLNLALALSAFFAAHWAAQRTNSLVFGRIDVSEAQWSMIAIHLATAFKGSGLWQTVVLEAPAVSVRDVVCVMSAATLLSGTVVNLAIALDLMETPLESNGIRIPRRALSLWPLASLIAAVGGLMLCMRSGLLALLPLPVVLITGLSFGKAGTRLIVQKLTKKYGSTLDGSLLWPVFLSAFRWYYGQNQELLSVVAWSFVAMVGADVIMFHVHATSDMKQARGINIFSMRKGVKAYPKDTGSYVSGGNLESTQTAWKEFAKDPERVKAAYPNLNDQK